MWSRGLGSWIESKGERSLATVFISLCFLTVATVGPGSSCSCCGPFSTMVDLYSITVSQDEAFYSELIFGRYLVTAKRVSFPSLTEHTLQPRMAACIIFMQRNILGQHEC